MRERLLLDTQRAKKASEEALAHGDITGAHSALESAALFLAAAPQAMLDDELKQEADWLAQTRRTLYREDRSYNLKRLHGDRTRKSRGHKRSQGGDVGTGGTDEVTL